MFEDSLPINLSIFLAGQLVAYLYLRTGRRQRGLTLMIGGWVLIDVALVQRFAFATVDEVFYSALIAMQVWSLLEFLAYFWARIYRRRKSVRKRREIEFRDGFQAYLRNDLESAITAFRGIVRRDPWDLPVVVALATALARMGGRRSLRRSRSLFKAARDLDVDSSFDEIIAAETALFSGPGAASKG
jgi:hypothetical protein